MKLFVTVYKTATVGAVAADAAAAGTFNLDVDANGRWSVEKFKGLMFQIEKEANAIAKATRRGKGNIVIASSDVASALQMAGILDYAPALTNQLDMLMMLVILLPVFLTVATKYMLIHMLVQTT